MGRSNLHDSLEDDRLIFPSRPPSRVSATQERILVHVQGQSGKFTVYRESEGRGSGIEVTMDALRELDADGQPVGTSGSTKHSINTFAAQAFTVNVAERATLRAGQLDDADAGVGAQGVSADKVSFHSAVSTIGQVRVDTYLCREDGVVGTSTETWAVRRGDLKWNVELSHWSWCGDSDAACRQGGAQQVGAMVEVDVTVKGLSGASQGASSRAVDLGGGAALELSDQVNVDGVWRQMPTGYPRLSFQGGSATMTFRVPRFGTRAVYDPVITGLSAATTETIALSTTASATTAVAAATGTTHAPGVLTVTTTATVAAATGTTHAPGPFEVQVFNVGVLIV